MQEAKACVQPALDAACAKLRAQPSGSHPRQLLSCQPGALEEAHSIRASEPPV
jgi:hypothetical protein